MSLNQLSTEEVSRGTFLSGYPTLSRANYLAFARSGVNFSMPNESQSQDKNPAPDALNALVRYIPTETITLYIAALSALPSLVATFPLVTEFSIYWFFALLTPVLLLLLLAGKRRRSELSAFPPLKEWPWWKLIASTVAFLVWSLAVPTTPYLTDPAGKIVASFGALLVSTLLTLLDPVFEPSRTRKELPLFDLERSKLDTEAQSGQQKPASYE